MPDNPYRQFLPNGGETPSPNPNPYDAFRPHKATVTEQAVGALDQVKNAVLHPLDTITALGKGIRDEFSAGFSAPVQGSRRAESDYLRGKGIDPRPDIPYGSEITDKTPGSVSRGSMRKGAILTGANIALAAAPALSVGPRLATNAGIGAFADTEQPIRGALASALLGEGIHGVASALGARSAAKATEGKLTTALQDAIEAGSPTTVGRRATSFPNAETVSAGIDPLADLEGSLSVRDYLEKRGRQAPTDAIRRRPGPMADAVDPGPNAETQSFSGVSFGDELPSGIKRRPGVAPENPYADLIPEDVHATEPAPAVTPEAIPEIREPVSVGGTDDIPGMTPIASAEAGKATVRRGAQAKANLAADTSPVPFKGGNTGPVDVTEVRSFEGAPKVEAAPESTAPPVERASDIVNVAKLALEPEAQQRLALQAEQYRGLKESNRQTFAEADQNRAQIVDELLAGDRLALNTKAAAKLSGEELLARRDVIGQNDELITRLSKAIESKALSVAEHEQAVELLNKAHEHNDALLQDLVTGSSQKGRDLNLLRRIANRDLDPATWSIQAKRMLGDKPLTDAISSELRRLVQVAQDACGGA